MYSVLFVSCISIIAVLFSVGCSDKGPIRDAELMDKVQAAKNEEEAQKRKAARDAEAQKLAQTRAEDVRTHTRSVLHNVVDLELPPKRWGFFPNLEKQAKRLRESVKRVPLPEGPNPVWLLMIDTTRADNLSLYGYDRKTTPHLDELFKESILFSNYYSNGSWTRPSVASILLSRYRGEHHVEVAGSRIKDKYVTLAEVFKQNDYATAGIIGNQTVREHYNFNQGFDEYQDIHDEIEHNPKADEIFERSQKWLDANTNPNWFLWTFVVDPHDPYNPIEGHDLWPAGNKKKRIATPMHEYAHSLPKPLVERMVSLYDAEIHQTDAAIGKMIQYFKDKGVWERLTVIVVVDHGEAFGEHNCFRHPYHFWEPNIRVPFMIRSPEFKSGLGTVEDRLYNGVDVAPTIVDLAHLKKREGWDPSGISAAEVMAGPIKEGWDRTVFTEMRAYGVRRWGLRKGKYKYLRFNPTDLEAVETVWGDKHLDQFVSINNDNTVYHLYDLEKDPFEKTNLMTKRHRNKPEIKPIVKELRKELKDFMRATRKGTYRTKDPVTTEVAKKGKGKTTKPDVDPDEIKGQKIDPQTLEDMKALGYAEDE